MVYATSFTQWENTSELVTFLCHNDKFCQIITFVFAQDTHFYNRPVVTVWKHLLPPPQAHVTENDIMVRERKEQ